MKFEFFMLVVTQIVGFWILNHASDYMVTNPTTIFQQLLHICTVQAPFLTSPTILPKHTLSLSAIPAWAF